MPRFKVPLERSVSRVVGLRQTTTLVVDAPDAKCAEEAAQKVIADDFVEEHCEWEADNSSRVASNDTVVIRPRFDRALAVPSLYLRREKPVSAIEVLGLDPREFSEGP